MNPLQISLPLLIAAGVPLLFLILAYSLDLYGTHSLPLVGVAFFWGGVISLGLAYSINTHLAQPLLVLLRWRHILLYILFAPIVEELIKAMPLAYYVRRGHLTFFVDGAIYGFAAGIGFSIGETFIYISQYPELAIPLAVGRALSTSLMHGTATALIGIAFGLARLRRSKSRNVLATTAWLLAVILHSLFNALAVSERMALLGTLGAMGIGIGSFEVLLTLIRIGLKQEKQWLEEGLDPDRLQSFVGELSPVDHHHITESLRFIAEMSLAEAKAIQEYEQIDQYLSPLREQFPEHADRMEQIILQQAQMGIKRRLVWEMDDPNLQARLGTEIAALEASTKRLRKQIGRCAMAYLDCVFDEEGKLMQVCVETVVACAPPWEQEGPIAAQVAAA